MKLTVKCIVLISFFTLHSCCSNRYSVDSTHILTHPISAPYNKVWPVSAPYYIASHHPLLRPSECHTLFLVVSPSEWNTFHHHYLTPAVPKYIIYCQHADCWEKMMCRTLSAENQRGRFGISLDYGRCLKYLWA